MIKKERIMTAPESETLRPQHQADDEKRGGWLKVMHQECQIPVDRGQTRPSTWTPCHNLLEKVAGPEGQTGKGGGPKSQIIIHFF
jgi:hypothetical protein